MHNLLQWIDNFQPSTEAACVAALVYFGFLGLTCLFGAFVHDGKTLQERIAEDEAQIKWLKEWNENHKATSRKTRW